MNNILLCVALLTAAFGAEGSLNKRFVIHKTFSELSPQILKLDGFYEEMGIRVIERDGNKVRASLETIFGKIEWVHEEKIVQKNDELIIIIKATGKNFQFSGILTVRPYKKNTEVSLTATVGVDDPRVKSAHIDMGLNKGYSKIKRYFRKIR